MARRVRVRFGFTVRVRPKTRVRGGGADWGRYGKRLQAHLRVAIHCVVCGHKGLLRDSA